MNHSMFDTASSGLALNESGVEELKVRVGTALIANVCNAGIKITGNYNKIAVAPTRKVSNNIRVSNGNNVISGSNNIIIGRIGLSLTVNGSNKNFSGQIVGTVTCGPGIGNDYTVFEGGLFSKCLVLKLY
ncbi:hypothetical protein LV34_01601 [Acinetobacter baumannii]|uniref:Uncharacterized protein n=3 Tax=Acinetobacter baumannii TaxID=470 RepID=A0A0U3U9T2_ACIBA|nr:hypothetical protein [Acinetobacter baumannii]ALV86839.1 hypothetical protein [Acinetobacter baumannii]KAF0600346.1 hypothetical protein AB71190_03126 [Acinetobacter baumannii]KZA09436.1 hypothetical protein LV34_01601 [Acinetobacter baumannii]KZA17036.1 hypothetical protein LV36_00136 [Acinetobacter baumannii]UZG61519.2 hypothetical protein OMP06_14995 [Acinetobacter baumannii]